MLSLILALVIALVGVTHANLYHVPADYATIQAAILVTANGDTVIVSEGTYVENIDFRGHSIVVGSQFLVDGNIDHIPLTVIDGSQPQHSDTGSVVRIISGEDSTTALSGFTITGGTGTKFRDQSDQLWYVEGGGVIIENADPTIAFNMIVDNQATRQPAGTQSAGGGGIRYGYCSPRIRNNIILHNSGKYGGGVVSFFADGELTNNVIANNDGGQAYGGGGLWIGGTGHSTTLINNTIVGNASVLTGGGIRLYAGVLNGHSNIAWGNQANTGTDQIGGSVSNIHVDYSCVEGNLDGTGNINEYPDFTSQQLWIDPLSPCTNAGNPATEWNDSDGSRNDIGCYGGPGAHEFASFGYAVWNPPAFTIEFTPDTLIRTILIENTGTAGLYFDSIAYSVGESSLSHVGVTSPIRPFLSGTMELESYPLGDLPLVDTLLVYHSALYSPWPVRIPFFGIGTAAHDVNTLPLDFALHDAYPNPFNPSTTISFELPSEQLVKITIHDIQGREVAELLNSRLAAGEHGVEWNATGYSSGTYFATIRAGKWQAETKLTFIK